MQSPNKSGRNHRLGAAFVKLAVGLAVVVGLVILAVAMGGRGESKGPAAAEIFPVVRSTFNIAAVANGELQARNQVEIRSKLEKQTSIVELVDEGARVKKGDVLIKLNVEELENQLQEEIARVEAAKSDMVVAQNNYEIQLKQNESELRKANLAVDLNRIEYEKWLHGDDVKRRQEIDLKIQRTIREEERLREKAERSRTLHERGFLSTDSLKQDETSHIEALANMETAQLERQVYEEYDRPKMIKQLTSDIQEAEAEVDRVVQSNSSNLASKEADLNNKRQQLKIREERHAKLKDQVAAGVVIAPNDGLVVYGTTLERSRWGGGGDDGLKIGQNVHSNQLLIALPDVREMVASVRVHETIAGRIRPGQPATVTVDAVPGRPFSGQVLSIGVLAESGGWRDPNLREYTVKIALDDTDAKSLLKPAMRCEAQIVLGAVDDALAVPIQAVFNEGATRFVYTSTGGRYEKTPVKVGRRSDTLVEIRAGLKEGQKVLLRQPTPGEVLSNEISKDALAALEAAAPEPARTGGPGGAPGGADGQRQRPQQVKPAGETPAPQAVPTSTTPAAENGAATTTTVAAPTANK
ncbi:MAG: efflux RND transporter periplasmic adaptor subunit [Phycisphaerales bacterium]|nr:efflux RND transporter periplasmic adaptor subunit [Phycisphaerales bacterium]